MLPAIPCALNKAWGGVLEFSLQAGCFSGLGSWCVSEILLLMVQLFAQHKKGAQGKGWCMSSTRRAISLLMPSLSASTAPALTGLPVPDRPPTPRAEGAQNHPILQGFLLSCTPLAFLKWLQELQLWSQHAGSASQDCSLCVYRHRLCQQHPGPVDPPPSPARLESMSNYISLKNLSPLEPSAWRSCHSPTPDPTRPGWMGL